MNYSLWNRRIPQSKANPTQENRLKAAFWATFPHSKYVFRGLGLILYLGNRLQPTQPNQILRKHPIAGGVCHSNQNPRWTQKPCIPPYLHTIFGSDYCVPPPGNRYGWLTATVGTEPRMIHGLFWIITFSFQLNSYEVFTLSVFWTSRGHRCRPFSPPVRAFNFYRA